MKFEVGQDRIQVHFLAAYVDAAFGLSRFKEIINYPCPEIIIKVSQERYTSFFSTKDLNNLFLYISNEISSDPKKFYSKIKNKFYNDNKKTIKILSKKYTDNWEKTNAAILTLKYISIYLPVLRYLEVVATRHLKNSLLKNDIKIHDKELYILTSADSYITLPIKEKVDLLKIAINNYKAKKENYLPLLNQHTAKYNYVELHVSTRDPLTLLDFEKRLKKLFNKTKRELLLEFNKLKNQNKQIEKQKKLLFKKYNFNHFEKNILDLLEFISKTKVRITDHACLLNYILVTASIELSQKWGVPMKMFFLMFPNEIKKYSHKNKLDKKIINLISQRKNAVIWVKEDKLKILFGKQATNFFNKKITKEKIEAKEIRGTPIFKGKLKGRVKIIKSTKDFQKIKEGDILISSDTTPDFVPIFNKISAIVTDEGGVICHAAIVAREMKIPCIVGTKIATKTFKDNDTIEIDAEKGIIKKNNK
ncbi:MAG TPA: hypothetical protein ENJ27_01675 [Candidatus Moranbacteria bacterium]|nr:hypothetical protein [Candidatus Moranbacteria bacterium]